MVQIATQDAEGWGFFRLPSGRVYAAGWEGEELNIYRSLDELVAGEEPLEGCTTLDEVEQRCGYINSEGNYNLYFVIVAID